MTRRYILPLLLSFNSLLLFSSTPGLIWHQTYGAPTDSQKVLVNVIDNYDNMFLAGVVYFNNTGSVIINRYDGVGNLMWNRMYNNTPQAGNIDMPVALFPNYQAGVTMVAYINTQAVVTHLLSYDGNGNLQADYPIGDTSAGKKTMPLAVLYDGASSFYMLGQLNSVSCVFKCDNNGNVLWSTPVNNSFNNRAGSISFDPFGNIVAGVYDSISPQVVIHRYNSNTGLELPGFNTHVSNLPVNGNVIKILVDGSSDVFLAATGTDSSGRTQLAADKFDTSGNSLWSALCTSYKGSTNIMNSFLLDHNGDLLISGPYTDDTDAFQYAGLYKISNSTGNILWSFIDSLFLVNGTATVVDIDNNVYLGSTKTPSIISPNYSQFSFYQLTSDNGQAQWNRSFDNSSNNYGLLMQVNNFGDLFLATNNPSDTNSEWFAARVGNAAGDSLGTSVKTIVAGNNLDVFPNPFSSSTNISFTTMQASDLAIKLYDINGQMLQQQQIQTVSGYNQLTLKADFAPGVYFIKLEGGDYSAVQRVVMF